MSARTSHRHPLIFHSFVQPNPNNPYPASKFKSLPEWIGKLCAHKPKCCHKQKCAANKAIPLRVGPCNTWKTSTHTFGDNHTRLSQCLLCLYAFVPLVACLACLGEWTHLFWLKLLTLGSKCRNALWPQSLSRVVYWCFMSPTSVSNFSYCWFVFVMPLALALQSILPAKKLGIWWNWPKYSIPHYRYWFNRTKSSDW